MKLRNTSNKYNIWTYSNQSDCEEFFVNQGNLKPVYLKQDFKYEYITKEPFNEQPRFSAYKNFNTGYFIKTELIINVEFF